MQIMADELESSRLTSGTRPISLTPAQEELCRRLDELHDLYGLKTRPSAMFRGALFAIEESWRNLNPDWLAQAAHSLREILYPFWGRNIKAVPYKKDAFERFGSVFVDDIEENIGRIYGILSNLAHHGINARKLDFSNYTLPMFENLIARFETSMQRALTRQTDVHNMIDLIVSSDPSQIIADSERE